MKKDHFEIETFDYLKRIAPAAVEVAKMLSNPNVTAQGLLGAIGEETQDTDWYETIQDWTMYRYSHDMVSRNYEQVKDNRDLQKSMISGSIFGKVWDKGSNVVLNDVGPGNIKILTAITLLHEYVVKHPEDDPLELKAYTADYEKLVRGLVDVDDSLSLKFAALMLDEGDQFYASKVGAAWAAYDQDTKDAVQITYYNNGKEWAQKRHAAFVASNPDGIYLPQPGGGTSGGEVYLENITEIKKLLDPVFETPAPLANGFQLDIKNISTPTERDATDPDQASLLVQNGLVFSGHGWSLTQDPAKLNLNQFQGDWIDNTFTAAASNILADGFRPGNVNIAPEVFDYSLREASEGLSFGNHPAGAGALLNSGNADSRVTIPTDPLVLDLDGDGVHLTQYLNQPVLFDIDNDGGSLEESGWVSPTDGLVVVDRDGNGKIDNISEMFSEYYGGGAGVDGVAGDKPFSNGFAALKSLDSNADDIFDDKDLAWADVKVWVDANHDGQSWTDTNGNKAVDADEVSELHTLAALGITSIDLRHAPQSGEVRDGNEVLARGSFIHAGVTKEALAANFLANPNGHTFTANGEGMVVATQGSGKLAPVSAYASTSPTGETIDVAQKAVANATGGTGNDVLIGDAANNWLVGGAGSDSFQGGAGDDVLLIDADDLPANINGGEGSDIVQVLGDRGVQLNLHTAQVEVVQGGRGNDVLIGGGNTTVYVRGGDGDDVLIGGHANDALSGESGDDFVSGGAGNDVLRGHRGTDQLHGGDGNDLLDGGLGDDTLSGGGGDDVLTGGAGDDQIDGGDGVDVVQLRGELGEYRFFNTDDGLWISDRVAGRDGTDFLRNVESANFHKLGSVTLPGVGNTPSEHAHPIDDVLQTDNAGVAFGRSAAHLVGKHQLLANDIDWQGDELRVSEVFDVMGGTAQLSEVGDVLFTPDPGGTGPLSFKYTVVDAKGNPAQTFVNDRLGLEAVAKATVRLQTADIPSDPGFLKQWHLAQSQILPVWKDYTGRGVKIAQIEPNGHFGTTREIFDYRHSDLRDNVDRQWLAQTAAGQAAGEGSAGVSSSHATAVAGVMVAGLNGEGTVGVAPNASLAGFWVHKDDFSSLERMKDFDVINNSWGSDLPFGLTFKPVEIGLAPTVLRDAVTTGRRGAGAIMITAAGNDRALGGNSNYSNITNARFSVVVGAINATTDLGALQLGGRPFSSPGASLLVSAPGSNILSSARQLQNVHGSLIGTESNAVLGTSFSAPIVSGIVALMLEANPDLGYRDVQEILAASARQVDDPATSWQVNGARGWNGGGMHVSHDYGYGEVDARAAVRLAETWPIQNNIGNLYLANSHAASGEINSAIPDGDPAGIGLVLPLELANISAEHAEVKIRLTHSRLGDLVVRLISPSGTVSVLMDRPGKAPGSPDDKLGITDFKNGPTLDYIFTTALLRGEAPSGNWTLEVTDAVGGETGVLHEWSMNVFGAGTANNDTYVFTDEYAALAATPGRNVLNDSNGGWDFINVAATRQGAQIDLTTGVASVAGAALTIEAPDQIENLIGGESADTFTGNEGSNRLVGGRGDDILFGAAGIDVLVGGLGDDTVTGGEGADFFVVERAPGSVDTFTDFATAADRLILAGFDSSLYADMSWVQEGANARLVLPQGQSVLLLNLDAGTFDLKDLIRIEEGWKPAQLDLLGSLGFGIETGSEERDLEDVVRGFGYWARDRGERVFGGSGPDRISGGAGHDTLVGGSSSEGPEGGDDTIHGAGGDDHVRGGGGNDILYGGHGLDYLGGDDGDDILYLEGDVAMSGIGGSLLSPAISLTGQTLTGSQVKGGAGNDRFVLVEDLSPAASEGVLKNLIEDFEVANPAEKIDLSQIHAVTAFSDLSFTTVNADGIDYLRVWMGPMAQGTQFLSLQGVTAAQLTAEHFIFGVPVAKLLVDIIGTDANDTLVGDAGGNTLDGGKGADILEGRTGDDTYQVDDVGDVILEGIGGGHDRVMSTVTYTLPNEVEVLQLLGDASINGTGNPLPNRLVGNAGNNVLDGGAGSDVMRGGAGDDLYIVDDGVDQVIELAGEGVDTVASSISFTLANHLEHLQLAGTASINATGNALPNQLLGNAAANRLDGAGGADRMEGGAGDDLYFVDNPGDVLVEVADGGRDQVLTSVDLVLPDHVENLTLGGAALRGTGNDIGNELLGNALDNTLRGMAGDDYLQGGDGNDRYAFNLGDGQDLVMEAPGVSGGVDTIVFDAGIAAADVTAEHGPQGMTLKLKDAQSIRSPWSAELGHAIERIEFADGLVWETAQLTATPAPQAEASIRAQAGRLVDAMAAFTPPAPGLSTSAMTMDPLPGALLSVAA